MRNVAVAMLALGLGGCGFMGGPPYGGPPIPYPAAETAERAACQARAYAHTMDPFLYPVQVIPRAGFSAGVVLVRGGEWKQLPADQRLALMRDVACAFSGPLPPGAPPYQLAAVDWSTNRTVGLFSSGELLGQP